MASARKGPGRDRGDYVAALLERARARAVADSLEIELLEGDAERIALPRERQAALEAEIVALLGRMDRGGGRGLVVDGDYLEAVVTLR